MKNKRKHKLCQFLRRKLKVKIDVDTFKEVGRFYVEEACGSPIFGLKMDKKTVCLHCFKGYSIPENEPLINQVNDDLIEQNNQYYL